MPIRSSYRDMLADSFAKAASDQGRLIEAGWRAYRKFILPRDASDQLADEAQMAFYAGAQHLFASIMSGLDPEHDPTDADLRRMDLIERELRVWAEAQLAKMDPAHSAPKQEPDA